MANIAAYGDSITDGFGLSSPSTECYIDEVAASMSRTLVRKSAGGHMAMDQSWRCYSVPPTTADIYSIILGTNDAQQYGTDAYKLSDGYIPYMRAIISWCAQPNKVFGKNAAMIKTGTWINSVSPVGVSTSSNGAKVTCAISGNSVYVSGVLANGSGAEADATVKSDGVTVGTIQMRGTQVGDSLVGGTEGMACWRFTGLGSGPHIIEVENTTTKSLYIDAINGSDQIAKPRVFVGNVPKRGAAAYSGGNSDANVLAYNNALSTLISEFTTDGANVVPFDVYSIIIPASDLPDGIHPNAAAHDKIRDALLAAMA